MVDWTATFNPDHLGYYLLSQQENKVLAYAPHKKEWVVWTIVGRRLEYGRYIKDGNRAMWVFMKEAETFLHYVMTDTERSLRRLRSEGVSDAQIKAMVAGMPGVEDNSIRRAS